MNCNARRLLRFLLTPIEVADATTGGSIGLTLLQIGCCDVNSYVQDVLAQGERALTQRQDALTYAIFVTYSMP